MRQDRPEFLRAWVHAPKVSRIIDSAKCGQGIAILEDPFLLPVCLSIFLSSLLHFHFQFVTTSKV